VEDTWKDRTGEWALGADVRIVGGPRGNRLILDPPPPTLKAEEQGGSGIGPQP
jgi:hypothetical protein